MPVLLSDEELEALEGLPHLHRCLYIFGIRRYMDYATGITGVKRKISYNSLSQDIYVTPHQGLENAGNKSRDQVKRALTLLEKAGLIKRKSIVTKKEKQLILECILANKDKSVQNKPAPNPPHSAALKGTPETKNDQNEEKPFKNSMEQSLAYTTAEDKNRPTSRPTENEKAAPYPISGKDTKLNYTVTPNFLSTEENKFLNLFTDLKLSVNLAGDLKAITTAKALVQAGVTLEVAAEALKVKLAAYTGTRTPHPSYFKDAILDYHHNLEAIKNQPQQEVTTNEKPKRTAAARFKPFETLVERAKRELQESAQERTDRARSDEY